MRNSITNIFAVCLLLGMSLNAMAGNIGAGKHLVLNLVGTDVAYAGFVAGINENDPALAALCFDVDLFNAKNQQLIGTATDCLSEITAVGAGVALIGTTTFNLPSGSLTVRGNTSVLPVTQPTVTPNGTPNGQNITHITGASGMGDAVISGSMKFANATGTARLSGMVDLSSFDGVGTPISFDCLFVIDLD
jgi:hypothetical protein